MMMRMIKLRGEMENRRGVHKWNMNKTWERITGWRMTVGKV